MKYTLLKGRTNPMSKANQNPKHWNLCTIKEVAQSTGFTEQNIRDRYKKVEGKEKLYNAFQAITFLDKEDISEEELFLLVKMYNKVGEDTELLKQMIVKNL